jgi:hypothetical protein
MSHCLSVMLCFILLSVGMLSAIMLIAIRLSVKMVIVDMLNFNDHHLGTA